MFSSACSIMLQYLITVFLHLVGTKDEIKPVLWSHTIKLILIASFTEVIAISTWLWMQANSAQWQDMQHIWGATWSLTPGPLVGPFSVRLTTLTGKQTLTAQDVIPKNWAPKATYTSRLNFA